MSTDTCDFASNSYGMPLVQTPWGQTPIIYADHTASGIPYRKIDDYIRCRVLPWYANVHSNGYSGRKMAHLLCRAKTSIRECIGATKDDALIFTGSGCSSAIIHAMHAMDYIRPGATGDDRPIIIISDNEHHSNFLPWKNADLDMAIVSSKSDGIIDSDQLTTLLEKYANRKTRIASLTACSNVTGVIQPVEQLTMQLKRAGWTVCFDFACSAPYVPICMRPASGANIDCIFISPHKFVGGAGSPGLLVLRKDLIRNKCPMFPSGGTVSFASRDTQIWVRDSEKRESGGSPNIIGEIRCGLAFLLKAQMLPLIIRREHELVQLADHRLSNMQGVKPLILTAANRIPIFPLVFADLHYNFAVCLLSQLFGIQVRGGVSCNGLAAEKLLHINASKESQLISSIVHDQDTSKFGYGWVRVTLHFSMSETVVRYILDAIQFVAANGKHFQRFYKYDKDLNNWKCVVGKEEPFGELDFSTTVHKCIVNDEFTTEMAARLLGRAQKMVRKLSQIDMSKRN
jgi:selenocysteine lyase/cysteine desulfurase